MVNPSWIRVKRVIDAALDRPPDERPGFVQAMCGNDGALRDEVQSMLAAMAQADGFIERPALQSLIRALNPGDSIGPYQVLEFIGAGGMGEVYRARDAKLNRDVALKVRSDFLTVDADRLARFKREAQVLASLNHPNVAAIYGLEESDRLQALVLELVEGPTLATRITQGPIAIQQALSIARQVAEGLKAAHEREIVHRDLKPSNIKLRPDGTVKILDFGLAKALDPSDSSSGVGTADARQSPAMSHLGMILGTAAYMSPEQARGTMVDTRGDIWAFGCVVYETLTGLQAFRGATVEDTVAAVLNDEPDWSALSPDVPSAIRELLRHCLERDPERRLRDIGDAWLEIQNVERAHLAPATAARGRLTHWTLAAVAAVAVAVAAWGLLRPTGPAPASKQPAPQAVRRLLVGLPEGQPLARAQSMLLGVGHRALAISPDGTRVAYVMERQGVTQLYLHALDQLRAAPVPNTGGAFAPFFSPDGGWIGFFADNKLKKVAVSGGDPIDLGTASNPHGGTWGTDGTILFAADEGRRPMVVPDGGGVPRRVAVKDDRGSWTEPELLPGAKAAFVSHTGNVGVLSLDSGEYRVVIDNGSQGRYLPTGHLVFSRAGTLMAAPFDLERLAVTGAAAVILEGVRTEGARGVAQAVVSPDGTLIYAPGGAANDQARPVWVDRQGRVQPAGMPPGSYGSFSLSPDGRHLAIAIIDGTSDVWVRDLAHGTMTRLTSEGRNVQPIWTPDGRHVAFTERTGGGARPFRVLADGSGAPEPLLGGDHQGVVTSFSPNADVLTFETRAAETGLDLWVRPFGDTQNPWPFLRTRFTEVGSRFSPDGRWIAYVSDESGQYEVYVRPYPTGPGKWRVSTNGGTHGIWSRDGRELFYRNGNTWMVVAVGPGPEFNPDAPRLLFEGPYVNVGGASYDVTADGLRFLLLAPAEEGPITHLNVVLNWFEEVRKKAGPGPR